MYALQIRGNANVQSEQLESGVGIAQTDSFRNRIDRGNKMGCTCLHAKWQKHCIDKCIKTFG
jgi:hypothetical protein